MKIVRVEEKHGDDRNDKGVEHEIFVSSSDANDVYQELEASNAQLHVVRWTLTI